MVGDSKLESQVGSDDNSVQLVNARSASTGQKAPHSTLASSIAGESESANLWQVCF